MGAAWPFVNPQTVACDRARVLVCVKMFLGILPLIAIFQAAIAGKAPRGGFAVVDYGRG